MGYHLNMDNKFIDHYKTNISSEGKNETKIEYKRFSRHVCLDSCKIQDMPHTEISICHDKKIIS